MVTPVTACNATDGRLYMSSCARNVNETSYATSYTDEALDETRAVSRTNHSGDLPAGRTSVCQFHRQPDFCERGAGQRCADWRVCVSLQFFDQWQLDAHAHDVRRL